MSTFRSKEIILFYSAEIFLTCSKPSSYILGPRLSCLSYFSPLSFNKIVLLEIIETVGHNFLQSSMNVKLKNPTSDYLVYQTTCLLLL